MNSPTALPIAWSVVRAALRELQAPTCRSLGTLLALATAPEPPSLTELADALASPKAAASKTVDHLESLGYLEKIANPADARGIFIRLSREGQALVRRITDGQA